MGEDYRVEGTIREEFGERSSLVTLWEQSGDSPRVLDAIEQFLVLLDVGHCLSGCVLVTLLLAVAVACAAGNAHDEYGGMEEGSIAVLAVARLLLPEFDFVLVFLAPFDEGALVVLFHLGNLLDINIVFKHFLFKKSVAVVVASVDVNGANEGFEGIAAHETVVTRCDGSDVPDKFVES